LQCDGGGLNPALRLAVVSEVAYKTLCDRHKPRAAILVSYAYLKRFTSSRNGIYFRDWALDSGAFTAHNAGRPVQLAGYIMTCRKLMTAERRLTDIFALDVIGDWRASEENTRRMWAAGVPAIPTYHFGEPMDVLRGLARDYPKIAIGGAVGVSMSEKIAWISDVFAAVWPKKIHGLAMASKTILESAPFHSVDASTWEFAPKVKRRYTGLADGKQMFGAPMPENIWMEARYYLELEAKVQFRWRKEMAELNAA
jgi:hypothetical protein